LWLWSPERTQDTTYDLSGGFDGTCNAFAAFFEVTEDIEMPTILRCFTKISTERLVNPDGQNTRDISCGSEFFESTERSRENKHGRCGS
jgi:hypothetical protein